ncbi:hypothetical protein HY450_01620 [Candidatus Pacearchaeota archaeon]|nr:hypothetical protein [Candidatus Pacearchaeota archaeon]
MNPIIRAYATFDDALMHCASKAAQAWNWTTGETKSELANKLLTVAPILESAHYFNLNIGTGVVLTTGYLYASHLFQIGNKRMEEREISATEKGAKDFFVEKEKDIHKTCGPLFLVLISLLSRDIFSNEKGALGIDESITGTLTATGHLLRSSSHYIMRTDYLPPRKNCIKRGLEKLESIVGEYRRPQIAMELLR